MEFTRRRSFWSYLLEMKNSCWKSQIYFRVGSFCYTSKTLQIHNTLEGWEIPQHRLNKKKKTRHYNLRTLNNRRLENSVLFILAHRWVSLVLETRTNHGTLNPSHHQAILLDRCDVDNQVDDTSTAKKETKQTISWSCSSKGEWQKWGRSGSKMYLYPTSLSYHETSFTKLSFNAMPALASKMLDLW